MIRHVASEPSCLHTLTAHALPPPLAGDILHSQEVRATCCTTQPVTGGVAFKSDVLILVSHAVPIPRPYRVVFRHCKAPSLRNQGESGGEVQQNWHMWTLHLAIDVMLLTKQFVLHRTGGPRGMPYWR